MISAGGSALLGCAADPSDPRRRRRPQAAGGLTSTVAVAASLVGIAMAPPWAAAASASSSPAPLTASPPLPRLRPAPLPAPPPPHDSARARLPRGRSPSQCRRTACAPRACAAGGEEPRPRRRADGPQHRRSTSLSGRRVVGSAPLPFPRRLPPLRHRPPPFLPQRRLCFSRRRDCGGGSWPDDRRRAARVFQSPLFSLSRVDHAGKRQGGERNSLRHPRLYPEVTLLLLCVFLRFFPDSLSGLRRPAVRRRSSSTLPKDEVVVAPSRLQQRRS